MLSSAGQPFNMYHMRMKINMRSSGQNHMFRKTSICRFTFSETASSFALLLGQGKVSKKVSFLPFMTSLPDGESMPMYAVSFSFGRTDVVIQRAVHSTLPSRDFHKGFFSIFWFLKFSSCTHPVLPNIPLRQYPAHLEGQHHFLHRYLLCYWCRLDFCMMLKLHEWSASRSDKS